MRSFAIAALAALLSTPAFCGDTVITKSKHTDASKTPAGEKPAKDTTETTWFAKDRMRIDDGETVTIVRADQKKLILLDTKAKTFTNIELPFDLKKYVPAEQAPMIEQIMGQSKATVTPTTETKKVKDWNTTKSTLTMTLPMNGSMTEDLWLTRDIKFDYAAYNDMSSAMMSMFPGGSAMVAEFKKLDGVPVLVERTQSMMGQSIKTREEITAVETKDAPEGTYDVPKDFTEKPFDPMSMSPMGGPPRGPRGAKPGGGAPPPPDKPKGG